MTVAAELAAADQSESGHIQLPDSRCRQNLELTVHDDVVITALGERGRVVVRVREHHNVVLLALSQEEMVSSLITQARWLVRIGIGNFGIEKTTCPCSNSVLVLRTIDRDRQNTVRDVIDRYLPVPP